MITWSREGFSRDGELCSPGFINNILKTITKGSGFKFEPCFSVIDDETSNSSISSSDSNDSCDSSHNESVEDKTSVENDESSENTSNSATDEEEDDDFSPAIERTKYPSNKQRQKSIKNHYISKHNIHDNAKKRKGSTRHRSFKSDTVRISCTVCGRRFSNSSNMRRHYKCMHESMDFKCDTCKRSFARSDKLQAHNRVCKSRTRIYSDPSRSEKFKTNQGEINDKNNSMPTITRAQPYRIINS
jgi:hypothetical protein